MNKRHPCPDERDVALDEIERANTPDMRQYPDERAEALRQIDCDNDYATRSLLGDF